MFSHPCGSSVQPRQLLHPDTVLLKLYSRSPLPCPLPNLPRSFKSVLLPSKPRAGELETAPPPHAFPPVLLSPVLRRPDHLERGRIKSNLTIWVTKACRGGNLCQLGLCPLLILPRLRTTQCQGRSNRGYTLCISSFP